MSQYNGWHRHTRDKCPICNTSNHGCMSIEEGNLTKVVCTRVGEERESYQKTTPNSQFGDTYLHYLGTREAKELALAPTRTPVQQTRKAANHSHIHKIYECLKAELTLSDEHKVLLTEWGIRQGYWDNFRTMPAGESINVNGQTIRAFPMKYRNGSGVPGFFESNGTHYCVTYGKGQLAHFGQDVNGSILCVEIRTGQEGGKYKPLSSNWIAGGTSAIQSLNLVGENQGDTIWVTEGYKKGYAIAGYFDNPVLVLRGIGSWKSVRNGLTQAKKANPELKRVILAVDNDRFTNKMVGAAHDGLVKMISTNGIYDLFVATWDKDVKGVDDAIHGGTEITFVNVCAAIYQDLATVQGTLGQDLINLLQRGNRKKTKGFHLFHVTAGVGKTTSFYDAIAALDTSSELIGEDLWPKKKNGERQRIVACWDTKEQVKDAYDELTRRGVYATVLEGRSSDPESHFYCEYNALMKVVGNAGRNTQLALCESCPVRAKCSERWYKAAAARAMGHSLVLTTKDSIFNSGARISKFDIFVTDESTRQILFDEKDHHLSHLRDAVMGYYSAARDLHKRSMGVMAAEAMAHCSLLWHLYKIGVASEKAQELVSDISFEPVDYDNPQFLIPDDEIDLDSTYKDVGGKVMAQMDLTELMPYHVNTLPLDTPVPILLSLKRYMTLDVQEYFLPNIVGGAMKHKRLFASLRGGKFFLTQVQMNVHYVEALENKVVINLDATPNEYYTEMFRSLKSFNVYRYQVASHTKVVQVGNRKMSKASLADKSIQAEILAALDHIKAKHGEVGILTSKGFFTHVLSKHGYTTDTVGWYGKDTRWSNKFKGFDCLVIIGTYTQNLHAAEREVSLLNTMGIESAVDSYSLHITQNEMLQAIERGRSVHRSEDNPLVVYQFSNAEIPHHPAEEFYASPCHLYGDKTAKEKYMEKLKHVGEENQVAKDLAQETEDENSFRSEYNLPVDVPLQETIDVTKVHSLESSGEQGLGQTVLFLEACAINSILGDMPNFTGQLDQKPSPITELNNLLNGSPEPTRSALSLFNVPKKIFGKCMEALARFLNSGSVVTRHIKNLRTMVALFAVGMGEVDEQADVLGVTERTIVRYRKILSDYFREVMRIMTADIHKPEPITEESLEYQIVEYAVLTDAADKIHKYEHHGDDDYISVATPDADMAYTVKDLHELMNMSGLDYVGSSRMALTIAKDIATHYTDIMYNHLTDLLESDGELNGDGNGNNTGYAAERMDAGASGRCVQHV